MTILIARRFDYYAKNRYVTKLVAKSLVARRRGGGEFFGRKVVASGRRREPIGAPFIGRCNNH